MPAQNLVRVSLLITLTGLNLINSCPTVVAASYLPTPIGSANCRDWGHFNPSKFQQQHRLVPAATVTPSKARQFNVAPAYAHDPCKSNVIYGRGVKELPTEIYAKAYDILQFGRKYFQAPGAGESKQIRVQGKELTIYGTTWYTPLPNNKWVANPVQVSPFDPSRIYYKNKDLWPTVIYGEPGQEITIANRKFKIPAAGQTSSIVICDDGRVKLLDKNGKEIKDSGGESIEAKSGEAESGRTSNSGSAGKGAAGQCGKSASNSSNASLGNVAAVASSVASVSGTASTTGAPSSGAGSMEKMSCAVSGSSPAKTATNGESISNQNSKAKISSTEQVRADLSQTASAQTKTEPTIQAKTTHDTSAQTPTVEPAAQEPSTKVSAMPAAAIPEMPAKMPAIPASTTLDPTTQTAAVSELTTKMPAIPWTTTEATTYAPAMPELPSLGPARPASAMPDPAMQAPAAEPMLIQGPDNFGGARSTGGVSGGGQDSSRGSESNPMQLGGAESIDSSTELTSPFSQGEAPRVGAPKTPSVSDRRPSAPLSTEIAGRALFTSPKLKLSTGEIGAVSFYPSVATGHFAIAGDWMAAYTYETRNVVVTYSSWRVVFATGDIYLLVMLEKMDGESVQGVRYIPCGRQSARPSKETDRQLGTIYAPDSPDSIRPVYGESAHEIESRLSKFDGGDVIARDSNVDRPQLAPSPNGDGSNGNPEGQRGEKIVLGDLAVPAELPEPLKIEKTEPGAETTGLDSGDIPFKQQFENMTDAEKAELAKHWKADSPTSDTYKGEISQNVQRNPQPTSQPINQEYQNIQGNGQGWQSTPAPYPGPAQGPLSSGTGGGDDGGPVAGGGFISLGGINPTAIFQEAQKNDDKTLANPTLYAEATAFRPGDVTWDGNVSTLDLRDPKTGATFGYQTTGGRYADGHWAAASTITFSNPVNHSQTVYIYNPSTKKFDLKTGTLEPTKSPVSPESQPKPSIAGSGTVNDPFQVGTSETWLVDKVPYYGKYANYAGSQETRRIADPNNLFDTPYNNMLKDTLTVKGKLPEKLVKDSQYSGPVKYTDRSGQERIGSYSGQAVTESWISGEFVDVYGIKTKVELRRQ